MVTLVDAEATRPLMAKVYEAIYGEPLPDGVRVDRQVIVSAAYEAKGYEPSLDHATICTEGVGLFTDDLDAAKVWMTLGHRQFTLPLHHRRVVRGEEVDFAEFVRVFGSRLESNWAQWERLMQMADRLRGGGATG